MASPTNPDCEAATAGCSSAQSHSTRCQQQRPVGHVPYRGDEHRHQRELPARTRTGNPRRTLDQVCSQVANRLVRTRLLGGVGGVPGNRAPIPIAAGLRRDLMAEGRARLIAVSAEWRLANRVLVDRSWAPRFIDNATLDTPGGAGGFLLCVPLTIARKATRRSTTAFFS